jgi:hypothetical protein
MTRKFVALVSKGVDDVSTDDLNPLSSELAAELSMRQFPA